MVALAKGKAGAFSRGLVRTRLTPPTLTTAELVPGLDAWYAAHKAEIDAWEALGVNATGDPWAALWPLASGLPVSRQGGLVDWLLTPLGISWPDAPAFLRTVPQGVVAGGAAGLLLVLLNSGGGSSRRRRR